MQVKDLNHVAIILHAEQKAVEYNTRFLNDQGDFSNQKGGEGGG